MLMYSFPNLEPVRCSMSSSNCCFLTCIQISQEAGKEVTYSHLLKNFPQLIVIHRVKGFSVVNKAEVDVFLGFPSGSMGKESVCNAGDTGDAGLIPGWGRSSREGNGNPFQYPCLENPMDGGAWKATVHGVAKSRTQLSDFTSSLL